MYSTPEKDYKFQKDLNFHCLLNAPPDLNSPYEKTLQYKILKEAKRLMDLGLSVEEMHLYWEKEEYR